MRIFFRLTFSVISIRPSGTIALLFLSSRCRLHYSEVSTSLGTWAGGANYARFVSRKRSPVSW